MALWGLAYEKGFVVSKAKFPRAHRSLKGWLTAAPERSRAGMPYCAVLVLAWTLHIARHGGPSDDAASGRRTLKEIGERGRWESLRSVRRYKRPGTLRRQEAKLSEQHYSIAARDT